LFELLTRESVILNGNAASVKAFVGMFCAPDLCLGRLQRRTIGIFALADARA
jgi:hypothetical protein